MDHHSIALSNGLRIGVVPMPAMGSVTISLAVGIGSRYEPDHIGGAAHLLEHMLFKGTVRRPSAIAIAETVDSVGGLINASTDKELTVYWAKVPRDHASLAIDLLADMLRYSRLRPSDVGREKEVVLEELSMLQDDPQEMVHVFSDEVMWPGQPVGREVAGTPESVSGLRGRDLRTLLATYYGPNNAVLSVAGGIEPEEVVRLAEEHLGDWPQVCAPGAPAARVSEALPRSRIDYRPTQQAHLCLVYPGIPREHPDRWALDVLLSILGGGTSSRLFVHLRERLALAYDVHAYATYLADTGAITVYVGTDPAKLDRAIDAIGHEMDRMRARRVRSEELDRARTSMRGRLWLGLEDTYAVASWFGAQDLLRERVITPAEADAAIATVSADDILRLARTYLDPDQVRTAAVGPVTGLALERRLLGA